MDLDAAAPAHTINVPLLRKVLEHITEHPSEWRQHKWATRFLKLNGEVCGTAFCVAGHAAVMAGYHIDWTRDESMVRYVTEGGSIEYVARQELGFSAEESKRMFWESNDLASIWGMASEFTHGEIEIPEEYK